MSPSVPVVIPACDPGPELEILLRAIGNTPAVLVDDGSAEQTVFDRVRAEFPGIFLLRHDRNRGKGAALRTAIAFVLEKFPGCAGIATADCDGQHDAESLALACAELAAHPHALILGVRSFSGRKIPFRSRIGNLVTARVLSAAGIHVSDSQTGLRGIPAELLPLLLKIPFDRFEFELEMLILAKRLGIEIREIPIRTIYLDSNRTSHFRPLADSCRLAKVLFHRIVLPQDSVTDWKNYYEKPSFFAPLARRFVRKVLISEMRKYGKKHCTVAEPGGGASSCFPAAAEALEPASYTVYDKCPEGIAMFRRNAPPFARAVECDLFRHDCESEPKSDLVFSVGLIEHFSPEETRLMIARHFELCAPGGIVILAYPTPVLIYRVTRKLAELFGVWRFPDERPLTFGEVAAGIAPHGEVLSVKTVRMNFLAQQVVCARRTR